jgi:hypothetical protein
VRGLGSVIAATAVLAVLAGCGAGGGGGNDAVELTKRLPRDAASYTATDLAAVRSDLDLPEDDPGRQGVLNPFIYGPSLSGFYGAGQKAYEAIDFGAVSGSASASVQGDSEQPIDVTLLATSQDTGEIGSELGDGGFTDEGGILVAPGGQGAVRLDVGLVWASRDADVLREIPEDPADELPAELLGQLDGVDVLVHRPNVDCLRETGVGVESDGSGEFAYLVDGGADEDAADTHGRLDDVHTDGDLIEAEFGPSEEPRTAAEARSDLFGFDYDC